MQRSQRPRRTFWFLTALLLLLWTQVAGAFSYYPAEPRGTIGISRPVIRQQLELSPGDQIRRVEMWLDGAPVTAYWDQSGTISYQPPAPLGLGQHRVKIVVEVVPANPALYYEPLVSEFTFTVDRGAVAAPRGPGPEELRALARVNRYRQVAGLPDLAYADGLGAAAYGHAYYLSANPRQITVDAHRQELFTPFFFGEGPGERARYYLVGGGVHEVINFVTRAEDAVDGWMDTLYHRLPLLHPGMTVAGYGLAGRGETLVNTLLTGPGTEAVRTVLWPAAGQERVPTSWDGAEDPDPFRLYPDVPKPVGYPITLSFGATPRSVTLTTALLVGPDGLVPVLRFHPGNDRHLGDAVAIIPRAPLQRSTTYSVIMRGEVDFGGGPQPFDQEWSFTTADEHRPLLYRARVLAETAGATTRTVMVEGAGFSEGLRLFLAGLPVEGLRILSETSLSFGIPRGYKGGAADLLAVTPSGWESNWPRFLTGQEAIRLPDRGEAFTRVPVTVHGRTLTAPALLADGALMLIPEQALRELGARPHLIAEINRTYWNSLARQADYTLGRTAATLSGRETLLGLPVQQVGGVTYVEAALVRHLAGDELQAEPGTVHVGLRDLGEHWARQQVIGLWQAGIVSGTGDGLFRPDAGLTRAAFLKMVVGARQLAPMPGEAGSFADTASHWVSQQGFVGAAVAARIILPAEYPGALFEPDRLITREEMAVMVTRAMGLESYAQGKRLPAPDSGGRVTVDGRTFTDGSAWSRPGHIAAAVEYGIITGYAESGGGYTFRPARSATRAEAAVMTARMQVRLQSPAAQ